MRRRGGDWANDTSEEHLVDHLVDILSGMAMAVWPSTPVWTQEEVECGGRRHAVVVD